MATNSRFPLEAMTGKGPTGAFSTEQSVEVQIPATIGSIKSLPVPWMEAPSRSLAFAIASYAAGHPILTLHSLPTCTLDCGCRPGPEVHQDI